MSLHRPDGHLQHHPSPNGRHRPADRSLVALCGGLLAGWVLHRITAPPPPMIVVEGPRALPIPVLPPSDDRPVAPTRGRPGFDEKLCALQDELIRIDVGPDRWDFYAWDKGRELEPVHLRNAGHTQNHRVLSLYKRNEDGTLDEEGMLVPIARLTKLDL